MTSVEVGGFQSSGSQSHLRDVIRDACQGQATKMFWIEVFLIAKERREREWGRGKKKREMKKKKGNRKERRRHGEGSKAQPQSSG